MLFVACGDDDLEPTLALDKDLNTGINSASDLVSVMNSAYDRMTTGGQSGYYGQGFIMMGEVRTDNAYSTANSGRYTSASMDHASTGYGPWSGIYRVIAICNIVIGADSASLEGDQGLMTHTKGQAHAVRALAHFDLLRNYGQHFVSGQGGGNALGVPYIKTYKDPAYLSPARDSAVSNINDIVADLQAGISLMNDSYNVSTSYMTKMGAYAVYDDVEGVSKGTPVTISGFNVGSVQNIEFFENSSKLLLKFRVENEFNFSSQSIAQIYETGLIGGKAVAVIPKYGSKLAISGDTLQSDIAPGLTELVNDRLSPLQDKIESMVVSADSVLIGLNAILNTEAKLEIQSTIENFSSTVADLKTSAGTLDEILDNNKNQINNIITNVNQTSNELAGLSGSFSDLSLVISNLSESSENIDKIISEISEGEGSLNKLVFDDALINSLDSASKNINLLIKDLRLNPKRYVHFSLFGKKNKPYKNEKE